MANIKLIPSFKDEEEMKKFFTERFVIQNTFNKKVKDLKKEAEEILKDHEEKILYSIPLPAETCVRLSVDVMNNFYHEIRHLYSEKNGIVLQEIQIVLHEYHLDLKLGNSLQIKFVFVQKEFNTHRASFSLNRLSFSDDEFKLVNNSKGACLDPRFIDSEKYFLVKKLLSEVESVIDKNY